MNLVVLGGRLVKDCELTKSTKGLAIAKFTVAVNDYAGGEVKTSFINCTAFGKTAESIDKYFHRGDLILLNGRINQNKYTNKEGKSVSLIEVVVSEFMFTNAKKEIKEDEPCSVPTDTDELTDEDLPF